MPASSSNSSLPCIVQVGFAGSRHLFPDTLERATLRSFEHDLEVMLTDRLQSLKHELHLGPNHHFCGISQVAIGADLIFSRACTALDIPQRVFLPQHEDAYLAATGNDGTPDFPDTERREAETLLHSKHVIERRLVSHAADRTQRFEDTNLEIIAESDVVICLVRAGGNNKRGGTAQLIKLASEREIPALIFEVSVQGGKLETNEYRDVPEHFDNFDPPELPILAKALPVQTAGAEPQLPTISEFIDLVKTHYSRLAKQHKERFTDITRIIIGTYILATLLATVVLASHASQSGEYKVESDAIPWAFILLLGELGALFTGFFAHRYQHELKFSSNWALNRLTAEISRSVQSLGKLHMPLDYLFRLQLPDNLLPLLRTMNVLHLRAVRDVDEKSWDEIRRSYLNNRLINLKSGQIPYYRQKSEKERHYLDMANATFMTCSLLAIMATMTKLATLSGILHLPLAWDGLATGSLGTAAIVLPVLAVGALSWAAAQDYEARVKTFAKTTYILENQCKQLETVSSQSGFQRLVEATELELLGETAEWYSRHVFAKAT